MNKKEVAEIKKQFKKDGNMIQRICGCYVDAEKKKVLTFGNSFLSLPEEEQFKYYDILKKDMSGSIGKNLLNLAFSTESELHGDGHKLLQELRKSECKNTGLLNSFYDQIIDNYDSTDSFIILVAYGVYDIPGKASDGETMAEASEDVYSFILCGLCPMALSKAGLAYNASKKAISDAHRDWMVGMPQQGFLFPSFNDRNTDIHSLLYYTKKADIVDEGIIAMLGCEEPVTADRQKNAFADIIEETLGDTLTMDHALSIQENLSEKMKDSEESVQLGKDDLRSLIAQSGTDGEHMASFDQAFDNSLKPTDKISAENITGKKLVIKTEDVSISVNSERTDLIETRIIDGLPRILITVSDEMDVDGLHIKPTQA